MLLEPAWLGMDSQILIALNWLRLQFHISKLGRIKCWDDQSRFLRPVDYNPMIVCNSSDVPMNEWIDHTTPNDSKPQAITKFGWEGNSTFCHQYTLVSSQTSSTILIIIVNATRNYRDASQITALVFVYSVVRGGCRGGHGRVMSVFPTTRSVDHQSRQTPKQVRPSSQSMLSLYN
jgi:hypothetical protein